MKKEVTSIEIDTNLKVQAEQIKWDRYYASLPLLEEDEAIKRFNAEFTKVVEKLLPAGSSILEAGCGAGWQSLSLARLKKYKITLMDFSQEALKYARRIFERENLKAEFIQEDVFIQGEPRYDLVFNAGVLEHYSFDKQVAFLKGMASRSLKYVMVLVPNRLCYWYWIWRIQKSGEGEWPFGKEIPLTDLSPIFKAAGLRFLGQMFMGESWTEDFINSLAGLDERVRHHILEIHRSPLIPKSQKSYLLAALGSVAGDTLEVSVGWENVSQVEGERVPELCAALGDALALRISAEQQLRDLRSQLEGQEQALQALQAHTTDLEQIIAQLKAEQERLIQELDKKEQIIEVLQKQLSKVLGSEAWAIVQFIWWLRPKVAPDGSLRERILRLAFKPFRVMARCGFRGLISAISVRVKAILHQVLQPPRPFRDSYNTEDNSYVILYTDDPDLFPGYEPRRSLREACRNKKLQVSLIAPAKNVAASINRWWEGIIAQTRLPDEIIVVESGSTDGTAELLQELACKSPIPFRVIEEPSANIARARNLAISQARYDIIACIDFGCKAEKEWLERLVAPFESDPEIQVSAGWYEPIGHDGCTVRTRKRWPQLQKIWPQTFLPSSRSLAFKRCAWEAVGGYPEWLTLTGEDTFFDLELKRWGGVWAFVPEAIVKWEAPDSVLGYLRKMFRWSVGDGEAGIHGLYYWRWVIALTGLAGYIGVTSIALAAALIWGGVAVMAPFLTFPGWWVIWCTSKRLLGGIDPVIVAGRVAAVLGFLAGARRRRLVEQRRLSQIKGIWFILSGVPIDDTGGGARATQIALELLRQGYFVVFISRFPKYESKELGLKFAHPNLRIFRIADFKWDRFAADHPELLEGRPVAALVEFPLAEFLPVIDAVRTHGGRVIYDLIDDWSTSLGSSWYSPEVERFIISKSDVLVATAPILAERLQKLSGREIHLLPNAVNTRLFDPGRRYPRPTDLPAAEWLMIYIGALWGEWFDWELLVQLADAYPEAGVLVVGDYRGQCPESRPNLYFLGLKPQRDLPSYLAHANIAIVPWKINKITQATSPLKVYEYLAMHKPVVAPDIAPLRNIPGVLLAKDANEFVELVAKARKIDYPVEDVTRFIAANNWEVRVKNLCNLI
ncbi:glycosyltransferase [Ammonifex thiophilus]|uniref:Glycosyltransferase n=1 Tax=Ammonifex thiophilus TaxID=444093 RepID=A0A3D8P1X0_9THEO|nr:glycosyltransferase [Ammonifex thiophilus]RDV81843.1 glycosyltransferase [Ammonifex thiophilus]